jgi:SAM-dependent methyltransferase
MWGSTDAMGQELYAYFKGKSVPEIVERDDGFISTGMSGSLYFADFKDWLKPEKQAAKFVKGNVLDIGCGAGRVELYFQKKGFRVVGIDVSPLALEVSRSRGAKETRKMSVDQVGKFPKGSFDTIVMYGHNFGLFASYKKAKAILKKFYRITSDNALIVASGADPYKTKDPLHLEYHKFNKKRRRMAGQLRIRVRYRNYTGKWFDYLFASKSEIEDILKGTGWQVRQFYPDYPDYAVVIEKE